MEFHEKLQELRKQKNLTQEALAEQLYVSRTAISKWESGKGYPNIDSLKAIAAFFDITVDALLSSEEILTIAEEDHKQSRSHLRDRMFGLLDCSTALFWFLPLFGQTVDGTVQSASLLSLFALPPYLNVAYITVVSVCILLGLITLALQTSHSAVWSKIKTVLSLGISIVAVLLFILSRQPYAAVLMFAFLIIKVILCGRPR